MVFYFVRRVFESLKSRDNNGDTPPHLSPVFDTFSIKRRLFTAFYTKTIDLSFFRIYNLYSIFTKYVKMQGVPQALRIAVENLIM